MDLSFIKDAIMLLIGLIALATAIVAYRTKVMEYKSQQNKARSESPIPAVSTASSQPIQNVGGRLRWWDLFMGLMSVLVFVLGMLFLILSHHSGSAADPVTERDFYFAVLVMTLIIIYQNPSRR